MRGYWLTPTPMCRRFAGSTWGRQGFLASAGGFRAGGCEAYRGSPLQRFMRYLSLPQAQAGIRGRSDGDRSRGLRPPRLLTCTCERAGAADGRNGNHLTNGHDRYDT